MSQDAAVKPNHPSKYSGFLRNGFVFALDCENLAIGWGEWSRSAKPGTEIGGCSLFTPDFYMTDPKPWRRPAHFEVVTREFFATDVLPSLTSEVKEFRWVEPLLEGFEKQVKSIRSAFENEGLEKAVPVVHAQAREIMTQDRLVAILRAMAQAPGSLIPQGFWESESGAESPSAGLLGATPERLFSIGSEAGVSTMALAGTRAKSARGDDAEQLIKDPKERHEHQIVIDDLRERLSAFGRVTVGETFAAELPTLFHLKTPITVAASAFADFSALAQALHPTPALGIAPRSFGFENMKRWDDVEARGRYGAPFGLVLKTASHDVRDCLVAIRNVQWTNSRAPTLGSGCGFVRESEVEREWNELRIKRDSVKKVLRV